MIKKLARFLMTSSVGGLKRLMLVAWTVTLFGPVCSARAPRNSRTSNMVSMSAISGMLWRVTGSEVRRAAATQGRAAFLAPLIVTAPLRRWPPSTVMRSASLLLGSDTVWAHGEDTRSRIRGEIQQKRIL